MIYKSRKWFNRIYIQGKIVEEVRTISKRNRKSEQEKKSVFLCKNVDPEFLGREVYADNVETPYNFYLIRELNLAKDYQNLAEGEAYFDAICDSWDGAEGFNKLVVKKIYMYVETEMMYYTLLMGSFEPLTRDARAELKDWLTEVVVEKSEAPLVHKGYEMADSAELTSVMKQMMEASNEMFRLRKMISDLTDTIGQARLEAKSQPVISRSVHTIHLKRAQPIVDNEPVVQKKPESKIELKAEEAPIVEGEYSEEKDTAIKIQKVTVEPTEQEEAAEAVKKSKAEPTKEVQLENTQSAEEATTYPENEPENDISAKTLEGSAEKLSRKNRENQTPVDQTVSVEATVSPVETVLEAAEPELSPEAAKKQLLEKVVLKKNKTRKRTPGNWPRFSRLLKENPVVQAPKKIPSFSKSEMESLEDDIYLRFMSKRMNIGKKRTKEKNVKVDQVDLQRQIDQAEYLNYSWGQVLKQRKEDVLICNRLSSANLVENLDGFLKEMKRIANKRSFFSRKVRCSADRLRRLEGYVLMDQYMQKLSEIPKDVYK
ncbi:hypothetical protein [Enterococcus sp. LJL128]